MAGMGYDESNYSTALEAVTQSKAVSKENRYALVYQSGDRGAGHNQQDFSTSQSPDAQSMQAHCLCPRRSRAWLLDALSSDLLLTVFLVALVAANVSLPALGLCGQPGGRGGRNLAFTAAEAKTRGLELRKAIDLVYDRLPVTYRPFFPIDRIGRDPALTDISSVVQKYIPAGTSFDEAEAVLRQAGFKITWPRNKPSSALPDNWLVKWATHASLDEDTSNPAAHMRVSVTLIPEKPADYDAVGIVKCDISKQNYW